MKKISILILLASLLSFTGCYQAIFEAIREDVRPEDATVSGNISSITRYTASDTEFLVVGADNGLRYKFKDQNEHGAWQTYQVPFQLQSFDYGSASHTGEQIIKVLADDTTLYLITAVYDYTGSEGTSYPTTIKVWGKVITATDRIWDTTGDWTCIVESNPTMFPIVEDTSTGYRSTKFHYFQTNAPMKAHRAAYICTHNSDNTAFTYYKLNGTSAPAEITIANSDIIDPNASTDSNYHPSAYSAVYFNGSIKFFASKAATTNETYTTDATYYYYTNNDERLYYSNGSAEPAYINTGANTTISNLATCNDCILIGYGNMLTGNSSGIKKAKLTAGVPGEMLSFDTNAQFQITSAYIVLSLVNATPEKDELESSLYASITFAGTSYNFDNMGLWSYYPARGNWNRE